VRFEIVTVEMMIQLLPFKPTNAYSCFRIVFLNRWAAARYRTLASIIPGCEMFSWKLPF